MAKKYLAKAKLNLHLYVGEKNEKLHNIDSLMIRTSLVSDVFYVTKAKRFTYYCDSKIKNDIVPKIILYLETKYEQPFNYKVLVKKRIPLSSGLGGESVCGAMAINLYQKLVRPQMTNTEKQNIASLFGSDIIYCLNDETSFVTGEGNIINPTTFNYQQPLTILCFPDITNVTSDFFARLQSEDKVIPETKKFGYNSFLNLNLTNEKFARIYQLLLDLGIEFFLTGTGPTLYFIGKLSRFQLTQIKKISKDNNLLFFHQGRI